MKEYTSKLHIYGLKCGLNCYSRLIFTNKLNYNHDSEFMLSTATIIVSFADSLKFVCISVKLNENRILKGKTNI